MKMTRRNFLSTSAVAALACGASLTAHAAGSTDENSLNFITDIFKDSTQPGEIEEATAITAEKNAEWYEKLDFSDRREFANAERGWLDNAEGRVIDGEDNRSAWDLQSYGDLNRDAPDTVNPSLWRNTQLNAKAGLFEVCDGIYQSPSASKTKYSCTYAQTKSAARTSVFPIRWAPTKTATRLRLWTSFPPATTTCLVASKTD